MTSATLSKTNKIVHRPRCKACKKQFRTTIVTKIYCSTACSRKTSNAKRPSVDRIAKARRSAPFYRLVSEVKRAGTLEILKGHTVESLLAVFKLQAQAFKLNHYGSQRLYELSHIMPVAGHSSIGLYCVENLVIAPQSLNKALGNCHYGYGKSIPRADCNPSHSVDSLDRDSAVLDRILAYLGDDLVSEVVKQGKIQPTQRFKLITWIEAFIDEHPEHHHHIKLLDEMSTVALSELKSQLKGSSTSTWSPKKESSSNIAVLVMELERHTKYRPDLLPVLQDVNHRRYRIRNFAEDEDIVQALFDLLHGKELDDVQDVIDNFVQQNINMYKTHTRQDRIPAYRPISFPVRIARIESPAFSASFADELDGETIDAIPVLPQGHRASRTDDDFTTLASDFLQW